MALYTGICRLISTQSSFVDGTFAYSGCNIVHSTLHVSLTMPHTVDLPTRKLNDRDTYTASLFSCVTDSETTLITCESPEARNLRVSAKRSAGEMAGLSVQKSFSLELDPPTIS